MRIGIACLLASLFSGCGGELEEPQHVTKLRVLTVQVEPPDAAPGDLVELRPMVADPRGFGRSVTIDYQLCIRRDATDPSSALLTPNDCVLAADTGELVAIGAGRSASFFVPPEIGLALAAAEIESFPIYVRVLVRAGEDRVIALATILATVAEQRNANPVLDSVTVAGETLDDGGTVAIGAGDVELAASVAPGSEEEYTVEFSGSGRTEDRRETVRLAWFTTAGELDPPAVSLEEPSTTLQDHFAENDEVEVFLVVTDGRGGVDAWRATLARE